MRRFLIKFWMLSLAIFAWALFGITAAIQQKPITAALGLGAMKCAQAYLAHLETLHT